MQASGLPGVATRVVETEITYPSPGSFVNRRFVAPGAEVNTGRYEPYRVPVHDARPIADRFNLDEHGFVLAKRASAVIDFFDKDEVDQRFKQFINIPGKSKSTMSGFFTDCWHTFLEVKGLGDAAKHNFMVRTLPVNEIDHRGVKSSFKALKRINTFDEVIAEICKL